MERKTLNVTERTELRKAASRRARKNGMIPAVVYGSAHPANISVDAHEFSKKFHTISENTIINLKSDGQQWDVLVKDYQEDIISGDILHIDFYEIEKGKSLKTHVPIHTTGTPPGVKEGGVLEQRLHEFEIECLPKDLPETIVIDVSELSIGDSIHVSDIPAPEGVHVLNMPEQVVVVISTPKMEIPEEEEEVAEGEEMLEGEEAEGAEGAEAAEGEEAEAEE
jgi:large subunit ribosomal protein L25